MHRLGFLLISILIARSALADPPPGPIPSGAPVPPVVDVSATTTAVTPTSCDLLMSGFNALDPRLGEVFQFAKALDPKLVALEKIPEWQDIESLKTNLQKLKDVKATLQANGKLDQAIRLAKDSVDEIKGDTQIQAIVTETHAAVPEAVYLPTEYDLKRVYEELLYSFDKELPKEVRFPLRRLPFDLRRPKLLLQAKDLLKNQNDRFDASFSTTGFKDYDTYHDAILKYNDQSKALADLLDQEKVEFAMDRPEGARWWVTKVGFQNQRATGSSLGSYAPDYRDHVEAALTGNKYSAYKVFDNELKPEYGYLKPLPDSGLTQSQAASGYGSDVYVFKKDNVRDRVTWTSGDSFGSMSYVNNADPENASVKGWEGFFIPWSKRDLMIPDLLQNYNQKIGFEASSLVQGDRNLLLKDPEYLKLVAPIAPPPFSEARPPYPTPPLAPVPPPRPVYGATASWADTYAAYMKSDVYLKYLDDYKAYMISDAYKKYQADYAAYPTSDAYKKYQADYAAYLASDVYKKYQADLSDYQKTVAAIQARIAANRFAGTSLNGFTEETGHHGGYIELQYFGPVNLDDVETFEFRQNPPSGDFLQELKKRGINIRDGRKQPAVPWNESGAPPTSG